MSGFCRVKHVLRESHSGILTMYIRGLITAARLKAVGVESVVADRLARPGDNWATRYDSLRFHIGKSSCNPPFLRKKIVQMPKVFEEQD